jgi:hypothetical protein
VPTFPVCHPERLCSFACKRTRLARDLQFRSLSPALGQVLPCRVLRLNHRKAFSACPGLDLLLAGNGVSDLMKRFVVHEPIDVVSLGEAVDFTAFVLGSPEDAVW